MAPAATGTGMPANGSQARPLPATRPDSRASPPASSTAATNALDASRSRGDPLRSGMNSPTPQTIRTWAEALSIQPWRVTRSHSSSPGSGADDRRHVDQGPDDGEQEDEQAGEAGAGLAAARQADDAGGAEHEGRAGGDGPGRERATGGPRRAAPSGPARPRDRPRPRLPPGAAPRSPPSRTTVVAARVRHAVHPSSRSRRDVPGTQRIGTFGDVLSMVELAGRAGWRAPAPCYTGARVRVVRP